MRLRLGGPYRSEAMAWDVLRRRHKCWPLPTEPVIDEIAIERFVRGHPVHLTRPERRAAVTLLSRRGWTRSQIAVAMHMSGATVAARLQEAA